MAKQKSGNKPQSQNNNLREREDLLNRFLENQSKELENESKMIEFRKRNDEHNHEYAMEALRRQAEDRAESRRQRTLFMKFGFGLTIGVVVLFGIFVFACFYTDNIDLLITLGKWILIVIPILTSGYFIGLNKGKKSRGKSQSQEVDD